MMSTCIFVTLHSLRYPEYESDGEEIGSTLAADAEKGRRFLDAILAINVGEVIRLVNDRRLCQPKAVLPPITTLVDAFPEDLFNQMQGISIVQNT